MRFRLVYRGDLRSRQREPIAGQHDKLANHIHEIRQHFHLQLKELWAKQPFLSTHTVWPSDYRIDRSASDGVWGYEPNQVDRIPLVDAVAHRHREHGYKFVPLVRKDWKIGVNLDVLFLRRDPPGSALDAGDIDNRMKTLIDGLRRPGNKNELGDNVSPQEGEDPFFCLLEDDDLVTGFSVETERLLLPSTSKEHLSRAEVDIMITVDIRPYEVTMFNLAFA